jgi:hypothetical protein
VATAACRLSAELPSCPPRSKGSKVDKLTYLMSLQERNERLFYYVLSENIEELVPLLSQPTIGQYCQGYSLMFRRWAGVPSLPCTEWFARLLQSLPLLCCMPAAGLQCRSVSGEPSCCHATLPCAACRGPCTWAWKTRARSSQSLKIGRSGASRPSASRMASAWAAWGTWGCR